jgi:alginate O-acetyltransferase complex protein AlgI
MLFCSRAFLFFFVAVFTLYWITPWKQARVWILLVASFTFYATWNKWLAGIICVSTALDYFIALGLEVISSPRRRRILLGLSLLANLGLLCYFKYANFFLGSLEETLHALGATSSLPVLRVILPIGISFYTFEAINYTVDVYRRRILAERNLPHFMLFILFFPHLVAGPIVRARDFLPQIRRRKRWDWARLQLGGQYFLMGLFKKLVIADRMAMFSGPVFENPGDYGTRAVWLATIAFAIRIYCDFSGYTDMALGCAHMLGYKLAPNFNLPYLAANISDFWRRWHMSLSTWLRDYLFVPLGGSRGTRWQTCRNLLITMTLGGLWHGVSWMFVVWGLFHGLLLIAHRGIQNVTARSSALARILASPLGSAIGVATTFLCVCVGWVLFYTASIEAEKLLARDQKDAAAGMRTEAIDYSAWHASAIILHRLFIPRLGLHPPLHTQSFWCLLSIVVISHVVGRPDIWNRLAPRMPPAMLGFGYAATLSLTLLLAPDASTSFIYFQF